MSVLIYARISTREQSDLSIPAQFRALRQWAEEERWPVAADYFDTHTGRSFRERPGLMAAITHAARSREITALLVHRFDRLARNVYDHHVIKSRLRRFGVRVLSLVERTDPNPMGDFLENIMAAQAEYYSANLALEVKKGIDERLRRGLWCGKPPVGYLRKDYQTLIFDPARAANMRHAFERYATGTVSSSELADELHARGLVATNGGRLGAAYLCRLLQNPFYAGFVRRNGIRFLGKHPALVSEELFARVQEVFRLKRTGGRPRRKLTFLLSGLLVCPRCAGKMVGEEHRNRYGTLYRYYRCHRCREMRSIPSDPLDQAAIREVLVAGIEERILPVLKRAAAGNEEFERGADDGMRRRLRLQRLRAQEELQELVRRFVAGEIHPDAYALREAELRQTIEAASLELRPTLDRSADVDPLPDLAVAENLTAVLRSNDVVEKRSRIHRLIEKVVVHDGRIAELSWREPWRQRLVAQKKSAHPAVPADPRSP